MDRSAGSTRAVVRQARCRRGRRIRIQSHRSDSRLCPGDLDDIVIAPTGILLTVRLIPAGLMNDFRAEAERRIEQPRSSIGAAAIVFLWLATLALTVWILRRYTRISAGGPCVFPR